jgi:hypothetical protein
LRAGTSESLSMQMERINALAAWLSGDFREAMP